MTGSVAALEHWGGRGGRSTASGGRGVGQNAALHGLPDAAGDGAQGGEELRGAVCPGEGLGVAPAGLRIALRRRRGRRRADLGSARPPSGLVTTSSGPGTG